MDVVDNIRTQMNDGWELFPEWIKELFLPIKEVVVILLDKQMEVMARDTVILQQCPVDETAERKAEFDIAKQSIVDAINSIITYKEENNPLNSPEAQAEILLFNQKRLLL